MAGGGEQRHDPAEAPAHDLDLLAAAVLGHLLDRLRDHVVHPVLEAEVAVVERDRPVVHEVRRVAAREQVLDDRASLAQVEAAGRRGERRHQQDRGVAERARAIGRAVPAYRALGPLVDDRGRRPAQVRDASTDRQVPGVRGRVDQAVDGKPHLPGDFRVRRPSRAEAEESRAAARRSGPGIRPAGSGRIRRAARACVPGTASTTRCAPFDITIRSCSPQTISTGQADPLEPERVLELRHERPSGGEIARDVARVGEVACERPDRLAVHGARPVERDALVDLGHGRAKDRLGHPDRAAEDALDQRMRLDDAKPARHVEARRRDRDDAGEVELVLLGQRAARRSRRESCRPLWRRRRAPRTG